VAENKTRPTAQSVAAFVSALPAAKRADAKALADLMREVSGEKPKMWGPSIIGFGTHHYVYESGREGDVPLIGFSPRKPALVIYGAIGSDGANALLARLGKHTTGKGCLYVKSLADVDRRVLKSLLQKAIAKRRAKSAA